MTVQLDFNWRTHCSVAIFIKDLALFFVNCCCCMCVGVCVGGMLAFYSVLASINLHMFFCSIGNKQTSCSDRYIFSRLLCSHLHTPTHLQPTHAQTFITYPHACNSSGWNFHWFTINNQSELSAIDYLRRTMEVGHLDPGHSCLRSSLPLSSCDTISALCNINTRRGGFRRLVDLLCACAMCVGGGGGVTETVIF